MIILFRPGATTVLHMLIIRHAADIMVTLILQIFALDKFNTYKKSAAADLRRQIHRLRSGNNIAE